jgi:hypothetical protein
MYVHGERTGAPDRDRVGGKFGRCLRYRRVLGSRAPPV